MKEGKPKMIYSTSFEDNERKTEQFDVSSFFRIIKKSQSDKIVTIKVTVKSYSPAKLNL